jgi:hypothetical protein
MAIRDPEQTHREAVERARQEREVERQRAVDLADEVFKTPAGRELLEHLCRKYHLHGRVFLTSEARASACPYAAAARDGEKAPLWYLIDLARAADPKFSIP